jgi:hypothetical protein
VTETAKTSAVAQIMPREDRPAQIVQQGERNETSALLSIIERMAVDPNIDPDRVERFMGMYERAQAAQAKRAYIAALSVMQPELPVIARKGNIVIAEKGNPKNIIQTTPYALWEDINEGIRPCLQRHGFALSFRTGTNAEGKIIVTGMLSHREGHAEETTVTLMHDSSGSKNAVQAVGSSLSYGKRYAAGLLLNITSRGEDDDGHEAGKPEAPPTITAEQVDHLRDLIQAEGRNEKRFLTFAKLQRLEDIRADAYDLAVSTIKNGGKQ